MFQIPYP